MERISSNVRKTLFCDFPGCAFRTHETTNLRRHKLTHETALELRKPFPCTFKGCEYRAARKSTLDLHFDCKHNAERTRDFQCVFCPKKFYTEGHLTLHIRTHTNEKRFACTYCEYRHVSSGTLRRHVKQVHEDSLRFSCDIPGCGYSAKDKRCLEHHRLAQNTNPLLQRPLKCSFPGCNYRCAINRYLRKHWNQNHNPERSRNYPCALCLRRFHTNQNLKKHIVRAHTLEKGFRCKECTFKTTTEDCLKNHYEKNHSKGDSSLMKCELCDYSAKYKENLEVHWKTAHRDERDFNCNAPGCNYKSNNSHNFKRHLLGHAKDIQGQFPFACGFPGCDYRRKGRRALVAHQHNHKSGKFQFACKSCPNQYPDRISWSFHNRYFHHCRPSTRQRLDQHLSSQRNRLQKIPVICLQRIRLETA